MAADISKNHAHASDKTHARIDQAAEQVKQGAEKVAHDADAPAGTPERVREAADLGARAAHRAADKAADWRERGGATVETLRDRAEDLYECACGYVREKPVQSLAIALAAGWLIGRVLGSRR